MVVRVTLVERRSVPLEYPVRIEEAESGLSEEATVAAKVAVFRSPFRPAAVAQEGLGFGTGFLLKPVKKLMVRLLTCKTAQGVRTSLERKIVEGPVAEAWSGSRDKPHSFVLRHLQQRPRQLRRQPTVPFLLRVRYRHLADEECR